MTKSISQEPYIFFEWVSKNQKGFQESASPIMDGIQSLHTHIFFFLIIIVTTVLFILFDAIFDWKNLAVDDCMMYPEKRNKLLNESLRIKHDNILEIIWTTIPSLILILIAVPSFILLYSMDEIIDPALTVKVIGHQWYWSYEYDINVNFFYWLDINNNILGYGDKEEAIHKMRCAKTYYNNENVEKLIKNNNFVITLATLKTDSYLIAENELIKNQKRLLEVDNALVLPANTHIRFIVTSSDVIHSFAIPSLGVKIDALPGRLNQFFVYAKRSGVFYGQCSEICGVGHGFMPIKTIFLPYKTWFNQIMKQVMN